MSGVLFFASAAPNGLFAGSLEVATAARELASALGLPVAGAIIGHDSEQLAKQLSDSVGCEVLFVDDSRLDQYVGDTYVAAAHAVVDALSPNVVLFPQTSETNEWVPRLAGRLDAALVTACCSLAVENGDIVATKPVSGGAARAEYQLNRPLCMFTVAAGCYDPLPTSNASTSVRRVELPEAESRITVLETIPDPVGTGPQLKSAKVVISGGLGVGTRDNWKMIDDAAVALGAGVGGSRAVVELGWIPPSKQVGFSGVKIRPDVYIAVGISGAVHHLAGISGAKTVVAINNDAEANIFRAARFGVVGDVKEVLPAFVERMKELRSH
ncbi:electron transfer flavoprotein subunit alpha/FixB family protein [Paraburkholderia phymatum]|uniref:Electron transfer flavoprotein alpha subunit n=1 Tax=Paraburkholderia phymatum (strain DSM 17167 / CIP 108236 / LMG 21445 / STM815) TaxID=391038 RepID=B2JSB7_PARP8|nr:electron transfer flavoprotein subunit alpha/FixB family protein [Paraburkholderia phymatum]ACC73937.1 Electron transfer flavoprotein alpha subunit [Paraburkholderia phymatum STM815]